MRSTNVKKSRLRQESKGYAVFQCFNIAFLILVLLITAYPVYYVLIASVSNPARLTAEYGLMWKPYTPLTLHAYTLVFRNLLIMSGYRNTIVILVVGLAINLIMTCLGAYLLSQRGALLQKPFAILVVFTMYFSGGIVPAYLNIKDLGLMNTLWALMIPNAISTYNMLVMRSAFAAVPDSLVEAAKLDGASHFSILTRIYLPLCGATMAVMVLYYGAGHWNAWFNASLYIQDTGRYPLQLVIRQILILNENSEVMASIDQGEAALMADMIKYALIVVSTLPMMILYPLLQRFFVNGVMIGALKG